jgi:hypothetical protein
VYVRATHLTVILPAGSPCHEAIAKVYEASQSYKRQKDGLLEPYRVGAVGFFFEKAPISNLGSIAHIGLFKKGRSPEKSPF